MYFYIIVFLYEVYQQQWYNFRGEHWPVDMSWMLPQQPQCRHPQNGSGLVA